MIKKFSIIIFAIATLFPACSSAQRLPSSRDGDIAACTELSTTGSLCRCNVSDLHPTQIAVGMVEVRRKEEKIREMSRKELDKFEFKNPEPAVLGPGGKLYIIDHHHLARALFGQGVVMTYCQIIADLSNLTPKQFWDGMEQKKWVYPFDEKGRGPLSYSEIPDSVAELRDDPYRSLAGAVRRAEGYNKTAVPFAEFHWAAFFRTRIDVRLINTQFDKAVKAGVKLARSPEAAGLPGYIGQ